LANLGSESETCVGSRVRLAGVLISIEKNFYRLPFTPPLSGSPYRSFRSRSFRFCVSLFLLAFLSVHCVSPHRRFHKPRRISTLKTKNIIFCVYLSDHNLSLSMDRQFKEDCKMVPRLKISSISTKEKYF
jgi:hypothetical protein